mmetsp:Transcript_36036/g.44071  ORF Transcript_36036/g.44071 Transcript_36036/m.44071 type:complete len:104 (+) Transcript_36036:323-634(+)
MTGGGCLSSSSSGSVAVTTSGSAAAPWSDGGERILSGGRGGRDVVDVIPVTLGDESAEGERRPLMNICDSDDNGSTARVDDSIRRIDERMRCVDARLAVLIGS